MNKFLSRALRRLATASIISLDEFYCKLSQLLYLLTKEHPLFQLSEHQSSALSTPCACVTWLYAKSHDLSLNFPACTVPTHYFVAFNGAGGLEEDNLALWQDLAQLGSI